MPETIHEPFYKEQHGEAPLLDANPVKQWMSHEVHRTYTLFECNNLSWVWFIQVFVIFKVEQREIHHRNRRERNIVELVNKWLIERLSWECREEAEEILCWDVYHIFVEVIQDERGVPSIGFSAVHKHEGLEMLELADSVICTSRCLLTFFTKDTHSNVSFQNHTNVICTIANRQRGFIWELFSDHGDDVSFLLGWYSAGEHDIWKISGCQEFELQVWIRLNRSQGITGHNNSLLFALGVGLLYLFLDLLYFWKQLPLVSRIYQMLNHGIVEEASRVPDIDGCFNFVTS